MRSMYHITLAVPGYFMTQHALLPGWWMCGTEGEMAGDWSNWTAIMCHTVCGESSVLLL